MPRPPHKRDVSTETRREIIRFLEAKSNGGVLAYGAIAGACREFSYCDNTIRKIWNGRHDDKQAAPRRGRPPAKERSAAVLERLRRIEAVPKSRRQTQRALAAASGVARSTIQRYLRCKLLRPFKSRVKPTLGEGHKIKRLAYALGHVQRPLGMNVLLFHL